MYPAAATAHASGRKLDCLRHCLATLCELQGTALSQVYTSVNSVVLRPARAVCLGACIGGHAGSWSRRLCVGQPREHVADLADVPAAGLARAQPRAL